MAEATIDSLQLEISANSKEASAGLAALTRSLKKLQTVTSKGLGLNAVVNELKAANASVNSSSVDGITSALGKLSQLNGLKIPSVKKLGITSITNAIKSAEKQVNSSSLDGLVSAVGKLSQLNDVKISSSIANQITAITTAIKSANVSGGKDNIQSLVTALEPLQQLEKSNLSSHVTNLKKLPETFAELNKIDMSAVKTKVQELATALKPLGDEMQKVANGFSAFPAKIQKLIASTNNLSNANNKASGSYINLYAKLKMAASAVKTIANKIAGWITLSSDYTETMNLFTVSMGQYAEEAYNYAQTVSDAMGIDPAEWMQHQGIFMTLTKGFGVVGDRANTMSQQLTQLGYDLSSFFNISVEDAMTKLQSGISGELEPLRRLGYDLSQAKLESIAFGKGLDKSVSSMTQAEKAELRYLAIMTQVADAHKDMARTLNAPANQMRILNAQVTQLGRALGNFFIPLLNKVLPYIIASVKVLREVLDVFMDLIGIELTDVDFSKGSITSATGDIVDNLEDGQKEAKKLKSYLLGFDELNVINSDDGSGLNELLGSGFNFKLPTYNFMEGIVTTQIDDIVTKMKEWLGITDDIDSWAEFLDTKLGAILKTVGLIGLGIAAWKVTKSFMDAISTLKILLSSPSYAIAMGIVLTLTGFSIEFSGLKSAVENGLNGFNFAEIVGGGLLGTGGSALLGSKIAAWITKAFKGSAVANAIAKAGTNLGGLTAGATGAALGAGIAGIIAGIPAYLVGIYDACTEGIDWLNSALITAGATAAGAGIGAIIGALGGPIGAGIGALIGLAVGAVTDLVILIVQKWDVIVEWCKNACSKIGQFFTGAWNGIKSGAEVVVGKIKKAWGIASSWFNEKFVVPVKTAFSGVWSKVITGAKSAWSGIKSVFSSVATFFKNTFTKAWEGVKKVFSTGGKIFDGIKEGIVDAFKTIVNGLIKGINKVVSLPFNGINDALKKIRDINIMGVAPFKDLKTISVPQIPLLAQGGFPDMGQLFVAREAGAELVGNIGGRTAVMNNDQIVESVSAGVYQAVLAALGGNNDDGGETNIVINLDGEKIYENQQKIARGRGYNMGMGAFSFG